MHTGQSLSFRTRSNVCLVPRRLPHHPTRILAPLRPRPILNVLLRMHILECVHGRMQTGANGEEHNFL